MLASVIFLIGTLPVSAEDKMRLWQHWEPGKIYHFELSMDSQTTAVPGRDETFETVIYRMEMTVTREADSERKLVAMKYAAIKMIAIMGGDTKTYDSEEPAGSDASMKERFSAAVGKIITLVYDKDDTFVDAMIPEDYPWLKGVDPKRLGGMMSEDLGTVLPREALAPGESFEFEHDSGNNLTGPVLTKMQGRVGIPANEEGRTEAKIAMDGDVVSADTSVPISVIPGSKIHVATVFDLGRRCVTRSTRETETTRRGGPQALVERRTNVLTLKSMEDAPVAGAKPKKP
jgi:hypothetical protein